MLGPHLGDFFAMLARFGVRSETISTKPESGQVVCPRPTSSKILCGDLFPSVTSLLVLFSTLSCCCFSPRMTAYSRASDSQSIRNFTNVLFRLTHWT